LSRDVFACYETVGRVSPTPIITNRQTLPSYLGGDFGRSIYTVPTWGSMVAKNQGSRVFT